MKVFSLLGFIVTGNWKPAVGFGSGPLISHDVVVQRYQAVRGGKWFLTALQSSLSL